MITSPPTSRPTLIDAPPAALTYPPAPAREVRSFDAYRDAVREQEAARAARAVSL